MTQRVGPENKLKSYDVIVLGAGGAGMMCAAVAGQRGKRVLLLDHAAQPGKKILISGGGRCNFTNLDVRPECYLSANPHFSKSALARFTPRDFIALVDDHGIAWHEKTLGQLFCDGSARQIVTMLQDMCAAAGVDLRLNSKISNITHGDGAFMVATAHHSYHAPKLVIATGGPSIPTMGATGFAYDVAKKFGLEVVSPRPALVPLTLTDEAAEFKALTGLAFECVAAVGQTSFQEAALFTHKGLSGPAILQISSYWYEQYAVTINFMPQQADDCLVVAKRKHPKAKLQTALAELLPHRLAKVFANELDMRFSLGDVSDKQLVEIVRKLKSWPFYPSGTEGFAKAEVTAGGVATSDLSSKTMEANAVPGLFFVGECVDVTGWLGGFNFQWAWASGVVAGNSV